MKTNSQTVCKSISLAVFLTYIMSKLEIVKLKEGKMIAV